jgi:hypothetical protein
LPACTLWKVTIMGAAVGNIIATIIITHIDRNSGARRPMVGESIAMSMSVPAPCQMSAAQAAAASASSRTKMTVR